MDTKTVIIYSSTDGQTLKICKALKAQLHKNNQKIDLFSIEDFNKDITNYKKNCNWRKH